MLVDLNKVDLNTSSALFHVKSRRSGIKFEFQIVELTKKRTCAISFENLFFENDKGNNFIEEKVAAYLL